MTIKRIQDIFGLSDSIIPLPIIFPWKRSLKSVIDKSDTKDDRTTNTNIKQGGNEGNGKITNLM